MIQFWKMTSNELRNFLMFSRRKTFEFWLSNLENISLKEKQISKAQLHYGARFLTRSCIMPLKKQIVVPQVLEVRFLGFETLFQLLIEVLSLPENPEIKEMAACQILILSGFYREHIEKHHNLNDLTQLGIGYFRQGAAGKRRAVIEEMAKNFRRWQNMLANLKRQLNQEALIINIVQNPDPIIKIVSH